MGAWLSYGLGSMNEDLPDFIVLTSAYWTGGTRNVQALYSRLWGSGLLENTIVVFAGEFGRTVYGQGNLKRDDYGRDHHPRCFSVWLAGGGIQGGITHGVTDDFSYNVVQDPVAVRDLHATILHQLGIDHEKLSFPFQGLDQRIFFGSADFLPQIDGLAHI